MSATCGDGGHFFACFVLFACSKNPTVSHACDSRGHGNLSPAGSVCSVESTVRIFCHPTYARHTRPQSATQHRAGVSNRASVQHGCSKPLPIHCSSRSRGANRTIPPLLAPPSSPFDSLFIPRCHWCVYRYFWLSAHPPSGKQCKCL